MQLSTNNVLFIIIFFNLLFVGLIAFTNQKGKPLSNKLFALFLLFKVLCYSTDFFYVNYDYSIINFTNLFLFGLSFDLLLGPTMLFYIRSVVDKDFKFERIHLLHLLPFIVHAAYLTVVFNSKGIEEKQQLLNTHAIYTISYRVINYVLIYASFVLYAVLMIKEMVSFNRNLKSNYSNIGKLQVNWLIFLVSGLSVIWMSAVIGGISNLFGGDLYPPLSVYLVTIFIFTNIIFFFGMKYTSNFSGLEESDVIRKYKKTEIPEKKKDDLLEQLLQYIETNKPYLQPDININKLSEELGVPSYQISQVLNSKLNKNFFEFISYYRIKESVEHLSNSKGKTVLEILYEVGFNSKSAFNNAFKKYMGVTPTEFKKKGTSIKLHSLQFTN